MSNINSFLFSIIFSALLAAFTLIFQIALGISLSRKLFCGINKHRIRQLSGYERSVQISVILCILCILFTAFCKFTLRIRELLTYKLTDYNSTIHITLHSAFLFGGCFTYIAYHIFAASRLYVTFMDSQYKIKDYVMYIHFITLIIFIVISVVLLTLAKLRIFSTSQWINTVFGSLTGVAVICVIHLIYQFNHRLFKLALDERQTTNIDESHTQTHTDEHYDILSENQRKILEIARKHTILGGVTIFVVIMAFIAFLIATNIYPQTDNATDPRISYQNYLLIGTYLNSTWYIAIFDFINIIAWNTVSLCNYLGFSVNKKYYNCICQPLDNGCKKLCESLAECSMERNNYRNAESVEMPQLQGMMDLSRKSVDNERDLTVETESTF